MIPSGSLKFVNGKIYANINYSASSSRYDVYHWCSTHYLLNKVYTTGNAHASFSVDAPNIPVDLEVEIKSPDGETGNIMSPANQDKKFDKAKLRVIAHSSDEWVLIVEGKDIYGNIRLMFPLKVGHEI